VVSTPSGRVPGTSLAARGRSRQPVASSTAPACSVPTPSGPASSRVATRSSGSTGQPVTVVAVRRSAPAASALATQAAA
jgi:hypothetical protein